MNWYYEPSDEELVYTLEEKVEELQNALRALLEWIDNVPQEVVLPSMPGVDRDWIESLLC